MTTANGLPASPRRRHLAAPPRALRRGVRSTRLRLRRLWTRLRRGARRRVPLRVAALAGLLAFGTVACAQAEAPAPVNAAATAAAEPDEGLSPRTACLEAARLAERKHGLPEGLLVGIALNESGLHAHALNIAGRAYYPDSREEARRLLRSTRAGYVMAGCVQVNARVHARGGETWPLDPWRATDWAAGYLRQHYDTYGDWGMAVVRWHGGNPRMMTRLVCRVRSKIEVVAPDSGIFAERCRGTAAQMARFRENGRALLELAEAAN
ncbi:lytic transglycosylase domain-containing protein [Roseomonas alkaliterrae]|nr:transglycosylase SLT domain-containing protein [Neoroseomonas alkaliterrae]MBR0675173.1 lytic transglycosylase domain-containing protein [Neoroseomonas alkaliterrae]